MAIIGTSCPEGFMLTFSSELIPKMLQQQHVSYMWDQEAGWYHFKYAPAVMEGLWTEVHGAAHMQGSVRVGNMTK